MTAPESNPAYALSDFDVNEIIVQARPVGWESEDVTGFGEDAAGNVVYPNEWVTTCPHCGDMISIKKEEVFVSNDGTESCVECKSCESSRPFKKPQFGTISDEPDTAVFIDPIEAGLFAIEHDGELLQQLDEELAKSL